MKYGNIKTSVFGITFDSKKEAARYNELLLLKKGKAIKDLMIQPVFYIQDAFIDSMGVKHRPLTYRADFAYYEKNKDGKWLKVVEDVKGMKTEVYKIKKKLFLYAYREVIFREIY